MATRNERFPSKYLKAADLTEDTIVTIDKVVDEQLGENNKTKPVAYWRQRHIKPYPLNVTNWDACAALSGKADDQEWGGLRVMLTKTRVMFKHELRDTLRIVAAPKLKPTPPPARPSVPVAKAPAKAQPADDIDDAMPTVSSADEDDDGNWEA